MPQTSRESFKLWQSQESPELKPLPKVSPNPTTATPNRVPLTSPSSAHSVKHCAPSSAVSKLQRQASHCLVHHRDLRVSSCLKMGWLCMPCSPEHHGLQDWELLLYLGQAAQEQSSFCLRHKRLWGGERRAWREDLCSSLQWPPSLHNTWACVPPRASCFKLPSLFI